MRHAGCIGVLIAALLTAPVIVGCEPTESEGRDITITLKPDGEHCAVRAATILCADLAAHLRTQLKLPRETRIQLQAGTGASYEAVRKVFEIIEKSGFNYAVGYLTEPASSEGE